MSKKNTIVAKRRSDGKLVEVLSDGSTKPLLRTKISDKRKTVSQLEVADRDHITLEARGDRAGHEGPVEDKTDWARLRAMTNEEVTAAAMSDLDARPMTPEQLRAARRVPQIKTLRRALALTRERFG